MTSNKNNSQQCPTENIAGADINVLLRMIKLTNLDMVQTCKQTLLAESKKIINKLNCDSLLDQCLHEKKKEKKKSQYHTKKKKISIRKYNIIRKIKESI